VQRPGGDVLVPGIVGRKNPQRRENPIRFRRVEQHWRLDVRERGLDAVSKVDGRWQGTDGKGQRQGHDAASGRLLCHMSFAIARAASDHHHFDVAGAKTGHDLRIGTVVGDDPMHIAEVGNHRETAAIELAGVGDRRDLS